MWELKYLNDREWNMHDVETVIHYDWPNKYPNLPIVPRTDPSGFYFCKNCKLMGSPKTFHFYSCINTNKNKIDWMKECGCFQCKRRIPCTWASVSMICHGEEL